jgi:ABC-type antimicrobial peptide transport system permease subunit
MILRQGGTLVAVGLVLGVVGSVLLARFIEGLLFGVPPYDPLTLVAVVAVMGTIGVAACWLPAARASRIDPSEALRAQ